MYLNSVYHLLYIYNLNIEENEVGPDSRQVPLFLFNIHECLSSVTAYILVLVRYSIYRSIAILVNVRYRYLVVSRYFDISNIE